MREIKELSIDDIELINKYMEREPKSQVRNIKNLRDMIEDGELILDAEYQRNYVQSEQSASKFVESIFLGCVIPEVQFYEEKNGIIEVLDGQQRITSLIKFLNNEFPLKSLDRLKELNSAYFKDLPPALQRKYKNYGLSIKIMKGGGCDYKYFVFQRLNSGSIGLTRQEVRNCIFRGKLLSLAKELADEDSIKRLFSNISDLRYERTEFILRNMAISTSFPEFKAVAGHAINSLLINQENYSDDMINEFKQKYLKVIKLINKYIFTDENNIPNKTDLEAVIINMYLHFNHEDVINKIKSVNYTINETLFNNIKYKQISEKYTANDRNSIMEKTTMIYNNIKEVL